MTPHQRTAPRCDARPSLTRRGSGLTTNTPDAYSSPRELSIRPKTGVLRRRSIVKSARSLRQVQNRIATLALSAAPALNRIPPTTRLRSPATQPRTRFCVLIASVSEDPAQRDPMNDNCRPSISASSLHKWNSRERIGVRLRRAVPAPLPELPIREEQRFSCCKLDTPGNTTCRETSKNERGPATVAGSTAR